VCSKVNIDGCNRCRRRRRTRKTEQGGGKERIVSQASTRGKKIQTKVSKMCSQYTIEEAFERAANQGEEYTFVYPKFQCLDFCFGNKEMLLSIGDDKYCSDISSGTKWYASDFIQTIATLAAHQAHNPHVQLIHCPFPQGGVELSAQHKLLPNKTTILLVAHANSHYALLIFNLVSKSIRVFDGLACAVKEWLPHARHILWRAGLQRPDECAYPDMTETQRRR
jgi:hypothetical protein